MRKFLLMSAIAVFGLTNVLAQDDNATTGGFEKGDIYASGSISFATTSFDNLDSNQFVFSPEVGFFITENISLEAGLIFGSSENFGEDKTSTFGGALGANYFFTPAKQFSFVVGAGLAYSSSKFEPNGGEENTVNTFVISAAPGVNYFVSDCIALRASVGALSYTSSKEDTDGAEAQNTFRINLDLSNINFGVIYNF
ncbi:outer membrane beta-barrel protein [Winogradskyella sp.]|uniref:outer membrane beta-barrel protein n=1 Tax=Winogradskyella sp. TaxID=1883156 RepID=UPI002633D854|nr:outer membrane beta-barrel protein [Winogradskyella sp.]